MFTPPISPRVTTTINCTICHELISSEETKLLNCGHAFHAQCIFQWFETQPLEAQNCPQCREHINLVTRLHLCAYIFNAIHFSVACAEKVLFSIKDVVLKSAKCSYAKL